MFLSGATNSEKDDDIKCASNDVIVTRDGDLQSICRRPEGEATIYLDHDGKYHLDVHTNECITVNRNKGDTEDLTMPFLGSHVMFEDSEDDGLCSGVDAPIFASLSTRDLHIRAVDGDVQPVKKVPCGSLRTKRVREIIGRKYLPYDEIVGFPETRRPFQHFGSYDERKTMEAEDPTDRIVMSSTSIRRVVDKDDTSRAMEILANDATVAIAVGLPDGVSFAEPCPVTLGLVSSKLGPRRPSPAATDVRPTRHLLLGQLAARQEVTAHRASDVTVTTELPEGYETAFHRLAKKKWPDARGEATHGNSNVGAKKMDDVGRRSREVTQQFMIDEYGYLCEYLNVAKTLDGVPNLPMKRDAGKM